MADDRAGALAGDLGVGLPTVAVVGRPNVGKSTLVNRILGRREAIVQEKPGVTRDRKEIEAEWAGRQFRLIDTGGWATGGGDTLEAKVSRQSERAIADADVLLMVVDATVGVTEDDDRVADLARRAGRPTMLVANKVDDTKREPLIWEFLSLGLGDPWPVSAMHGRGAADLLDAVVAALPPEAESSDLDAGVGTASGGWDPAGAPGDHDERPPASAGPASPTGPAAVGVALVGRPNVGKSTLFNHLIGDERSVVHDVAGTTRDSIDTLVETEVGPIRFIDTAGMRRRSRIDDGTEYYSLVRALQAVDGADIALLVVDATIGVTHQDQRLAERVDAAGCPIVVLLNKWDLLDAEGRETARRSVEDRLYFLGEVAVLPISARSGKGVHKLLPVLGTTTADYRTRVPTTQVNRVLREAQARHPAPDGARVLYATQGATEPPTFTLFANKELHRTYLRFLERTLREAFDLGTVPIKLRVRRR